MRTPLISSSSDVSFRTALAYVTHFLLLHSHSLSIPCLFVPVSLTILSWQVFCVTVFLLPSSISYVFFLHPSFFIGVFGIWCLSSLASHPHHHLDHHQHHHLHRSMGGRTFKKYLFLAVLTISLLGFFYQYNSPVCFSKPGLTEYVGPEVSLSALCIPFSVISFHLLSSPPFFSPSFPLQDDCLLLDSHLLPSSPLDSFSLCFLCCFFSWKERK